jgi:MFS family permease
MFYHWFVMAGVALVVFPVGGGLLNSFGVLLPVITGEFGWSRAGVSLALTFGVLGFGLPSPLYGILTNRFGSRRVIIIGNTLAALGLAGVSLVQEVWHLYLFYIIAGLGAGLGGIIPNTFVLINWFIRRRSLALGIMQSCAGLAGFVYPPVATALIESIGWRLTWLIFGGIIIIASVVIGGGFLIRNKPEDKGLVPDGTPLDAFLKYEKESSFSAGNGEQPGWGVLRVLKEPTVWLIGGFAAAGGFAFGTVSAHQIAYVQDIGYSPMSAATTVSVLSAFNIIGSLGFGFLALKFNHRYLTVLSFIAQIIALVILITARELAFIYIFAVLLGYSNGSLITAYPTLVGDYYPRQHYSQMLGMIVPFYVVANAVSATIAGAVFDATSSYNSVFIAAALFGTVGLILAFFTRRPKQS